MAPVVNGTANGKKESDSDSDDESSEDEAEVISLSPPPLLDVALCMQHKHPPPLYIDFGGCRSLNF